MVWKDPKDGGWKAFADRYILVGDDGSKLQETNRLVDWSIDLSRKGANEEIGRSIYR